MNLLWTDFLNSEWNDWRGSGRSEDRLHQTWWVEHFLQEWKLQATVTPDPQTMQALVRLRAVIRQMIGTMRQGIPLQMPDIESINAYLARGALVKQLKWLPEQHQQHPTIELVPIAEEWELVMAEIAASFADTLTTGDFSRVRFCENQDCLWIFYDTTRNRSKRFCDDKMCGNLLKVRRHRANHAKEKSQT